MIIYMHRKCERLNTQMSTVVLSERRDTGEFYFVLFTSLRLLY